MYKSSITAIRNVLENKDPNAKVKTLVRSGLGGGDEDYNLVVKILKDPKYAAQNPEFRPKLLQILKELIDAVTKDELIYTRTRTTVKRKDVQKEETEMELNDIVEGKMGQLHADLEELIGKHVESYKKGHLGADQFGTHCIKTAAKISRLHGLKKEHAQNFVNSYVEKELKEEEDDMLDDTKKLAKLIETAANILKNTPSSEPEEELLDEGRGRPRKNPDDPKWQKKPVSTKKSDDEDDEDDFGPDTGPEPDQNIRNQLNKVIDTKGKHKIKFEDKSAHAIHPDHAKAIINGLNKMKPMERLKVQNKLYKSHKDLMDVHASISGKK